MLDAVGGREKIKGGRKNVVSNARTRAIATGALRFAARGEITPGPRMVLPELLRGHARGGHAHRGAWNGKWGAGHDGVELLGASLRVPESRTAARRPVLRDQRGILRGLGPGEAQNSAGTRAFLEQAVPHEHGKGGAALRNVDRKALARSYCSHAEDDAADAYATGLGGQGLAELIQSRLSYRQSAIPGGDRGSRFLPGFAA